MLLYDIKWSRELYPYRKFLRRLRDLCLESDLEITGGNVTGIDEFADEIEAKRLGLLREVVQGATTIAVLLNPKAPG